MNKPTIDNPPPALTPEPLPPASPPPKIPPLNPEVEFLMILGAWAIARETLEEKQALLTLAILNHKKR